MQGWGAPLATSGFWAGLLLWDLRPAPVASWPWWAWLVLGCTSLAAAAATAPRRRRTDPLHHAGLVDDDHPAVASMAHGAIAVEDASEKVRHQLGLKHWQVGLFGLPGNDTESREVPRHAC